MAARSSAGGNLFTYSLEACSAATRPVIEALLQMAEQDPYPVGHTSSYWREWGERNVIARDGAALTLQGVGIGGVGKRRLAGRALGVLERLSYRSVTSRLSTYRTVWRLTTRLARDLSCRLTFDVWKYSVVLAVLSDHWRQYGLSPRTFALIGDGHGFLGALIRRYLPGIHVYCIDLPKTLVFQVRAHSLTDPGASIALLASGQPLRDEHAAVTVVLPQDIERISDEIDCAINVASMQEMTAFSIASYFAFLRRRSTPQSRLYCVNRLRKELPGGEIASFTEYPWRRDDQIFIDGVCPYYTHFLAPYTGRNGPTIFGVRVPWVNSFDGVHVHRLVRLVPER